MEQKRMPETMTAPDPASTVEQQVEAFKAEHPEVREALDLFNVAYGQYAAVVQAQREVKTYVTAHTLMPGEHA